MGKKNFVKLIPRKLKDVQCNWIDRDALMLHYAFECLCNYVEEELLQSLQGKDIDYENLDDSAKEALRLYDWWVNDYEKIQDEGWYNSFPENSHYTWRDLDEHEKLYDLFVIRTTLWS